MQTGSGYLIDTIKNYQTNISNNIDSQRLPDMIIIVTFKILSSGNSPNIWNIDDVFKLKKQHAKHWAPINRLKVDCLVIKPLFRHVFR